MTTTGAPLRGRERIFLLLLLGAVLVSGVPRIHDPAFWDETKVYFRPLFQLFEGISVWHQAPATPFDRPPGLHVFYLPFLWVLGPKLELIRGLNLGYFASGLLFLYLALRRVSALLAGVTVGLVLLAPIFRVYLIQYAGEPQLLSLYALWLFLLGRYPQARWRFFFLGILLGLTRETSLALIPATLLFWRLSGVKLGRRELLSQTGLLLGCFFWWGYLTLKAGSPFHHITLQREDLDLLAGPVARGMKLWRAYLMPYRILPLFILPFLAVKHWRVHRLSPEAGFSLVLVLSYLFVLSGHRLAIPRYFLAIVPFTYFFLLTWLRPLLSGQPMTSVVLILVLGPQLLLGDPAREPQDSVEYGEILRLHQRVIREVKEKCPTGGVVMTSWPFVEILRSGYVGYGPRVDYQLVYQPQDGVLPDIILWTNFPRQIPDVTLWETVKKGDYQRQDFTFRNYRLMLFKKDSVCHGGRVTHEDLPMGFPE